MISPSVLGNTESKNYIWNNVTCEKKSSDFNGNNNKKEK